MPSRHSGRAMLIAALALTVPLGALQAESSTAPNAAVSTSGGSGTSVEGGVGGVSGSKVAAPSKDDLRAIELFWEGLRCLRTEDEGSRERGRQLLVESASLELAQAQDFLGQCYLGGRSGFPKDLKKGVNWLRLASERGLGFSKVALAACLLEGHGATKDLVEAERLLREALAPEAKYERVSPPAGEKLASVPLDDGESTVSGAVPVPPADYARSQAHFFLGELYTSQGKHAQAQAEYLLAARQGENGRAGHYKACIKSALNYAFGRGVPRDSRKAAEMLEVSRHLMKRLGSVYARSLVDSKQVDTFAQAEVEDQLQRQAQQEERRMAMEVASSLSNRKSPNYDIAEAFKWLELSVEDGQSWAMNSLGLLYLDTKAGRLNAVKARELFKAAADKDGDGLAWGNYAVCLQQGIGGGKDPAAAMAIFNKHKGEDILNYLGAVGRCPTAPMSYEERLKLTAQLAEKKDPQALYLLGCYIVYGVRKPEMMNAGFVMLSKSADLGNAEGLSELGTVFMSMGQQTRGEKGEEFLRMALSYLKRGADKGSIQGIVNLGRCYQDAIGVLKDEDEAMRLYDVCLQKEPGHPVALNNMSQLYYSRYAEAAMRLDESGMEAMRGKMLSLLEAADKKGFMLAAKNLGCLYYEGQLGKKDFTAAYQHFDDAANRGDSYSRRMLGVMLERGEGVPVSYAEAAYHYRIAALAGDAYALDQLCRFYRNGLGVTRDPERALYWLRLALKNGNYTARVQIADVLLEKGDADGARKVLEQATPAEQMQRGFKGAYSHRLGLMYERGAGVPLDEVKGRELRDAAFALENPDELFLRSKEALEDGLTTAAAGLLTRATKAGHRDANFVLAQLYEEGRGVRKDVIAAVRCYRSAAERGHREAKFCLAKYALKGAFGAPSYEEAIKLCSDAEEGGVAGAVELRAELEKRRAVQKDAAATQAR